jgi:RNA polymerase primary sigma factor
MSNMTTQEAILVRISSTNSSASLAKLCQHPVLSRKETDKLVRKAKRGDRKAFNDLAEHNMRLVVKLARRYRWSGLPVQDLVNEGFCGFTIAVKKFDPKRGYALSTYASYWIRHAMLHAIAETDRLVRIPSHGLELIGRMRRVLRKIYALEGKEHPEPEEVLAALGMEAKKPNVRKVAGLLLLKNSGHHSLDAPHLDDEGHTEKRLDLLHANEEAADDAITRVQRVTFVRKLLKRLPPGMDRDIILRRFGISDGRKKREQETLQAIGETYDYTREAIRLRERDALQLLRSLARNARERGEI